MTPALAQRGRYVLGAATLFVLAGALHDGAWPLVALGASIAIAVGAAAVWFYPTAILLRRRKIELAWWVPAQDARGGALTVDHPFALHVALRNHGPVGLRVLALRIVGPDALELPGALEAHIPGGREVMLAPQVVPRAVGQWVLQGAEIVLGDLLGLFEVRAYFPSPMALTVFPVMTAARAEIALPRPQLGTPDERGGRHRTRHRGLSGHLRELREHQFGDAFKMIAWKATARKRRLMVRDLDNEIVMTHQLLVDVGATMRHGAPGRQRLDAAIASAVQLARESLEAGDRVGLTTFDARVVERLGPGEGRPHLLRLVERLIESRHAVDEDLTDLTDGELVALTARYLLHQEALDVRLVGAPAVDDPRWAKIAAGPDGQLYDMAAIGQVLGALLKGHAAGHKGKAALNAIRVKVSDGADPELTRLRVFARLRGVPLPWRVQGPHARAAGLTAALAAGPARERAQMLVVVSDLGGLLEHPELLHAVFASGPRRARQIVVVMPDPTRHGSDGPLTERGRRVARLHALAERRRVDAARALLAPMGIHVIGGGGPEDLVAQLAPRRQLERAG